MADMQANIGGAILLITGIAVATLVLIFSGALGGQTYNLVEPEIDTIGDDSTYTQLFTHVANNTNKSLGTSPVEDFRFYNATTQAVGNASFSFNLTAGTWSLTNNSFNDSSITVLSRYDNTTVQGYVKDAVISGFKAQKTTGTYMPLIVLAAVISLVLGMVLGLGSKPGSGSGYAL